MSIKYSFSMIAAAVLLSLAACGGKGEQGASAPDAADTAALDAAAWADSCPDSTLYGRVDGFGQSAFTFIADDGTEYDVALTDGVSARCGEIVGSRQDTARYAVTLTSDGETLVAMVNLSQLGAITSDYEVRNAHIALGEAGRREQVTVSELSDTLLRAKGLSGREYVMRRK